jgi:hypothetical protein
MSDNINVKKKTLHRNDLATRDQLNTGAELRCFERDSSSCSTYCQIRRTSSDMKIILDTSMCKFIQLIVIKHEFMTK